MINKKIVRLSEQDVIKLVKKIIKENDEWFDEDLSGDFNVKIEFNLNKPTDESYNGNDFEYGEFDEFYETFKIPFSKWVEITGDSDIEDKEIIFDNYNETVSLIIEYMVINEPIIYEKLNDFINNTTDVEGFISVIMTPNINVGSPNQSNKNKVDNTLKNILKNKPSRIDWNTYTTYLEDGSPIMVPKKDRLTWNDLGKNSGDFDFLELFDPSFTYIFPNNKYKQRIIFIQDGNYVYTNDKQVRPKNLVFTIEELYDMYINNKIGPQFLNNSKNKPS